jgi:hypothetical protein
MAKWTTTGCLAALALGMVAGQNAHGQLQMPDALKNVLQKGPQTPTPAPPPPPPPPPVQTATPDVPTADVVQMPASPGQLFHRKGATGTDLAFVLQGLARSAQQRQSRNFLLRASPPAAAASSNFMSDLADKGWATMMASYSDLGEGKSYSDRSLDHFLGGLLDNKTGLESHRVDLPEKGETMTVVQQKRLLILGAMVIGAKIANETLQQAHENFKIISTQYEGLLERRQKAAEVLADVMSRRRQALAAKNELEARKLTNGLSDDDLKFIDSFGPTITVETFSNDVGLQNLALAYLRRSDKPEDKATYADYVVEQKKFVSSSKAYVQTVGGVAAFGAFSGLFVKQLLDMVHAKDYTGGLAALTLIRDFVKEAKPLIKSSNDALYDGLVTAPKAAHRTYRIEQAGMLTDIDRAADVFKALNASNDKHWFDDALFRDGTPGFISHVYLCDPEHAGDLLDSAVPAVQRKQFAQEYLSWQADGAFSFADALYDESATATGTGADTGKKRLAEPLLNRDQRKHADSVAIGQIQEQTVAKDETWNDIQLMRMILANGDGTRAQMQLGSSIVRLVPSMSTIYAYESYADVCIKTASEDPAARAAEQSSTKPAKRSCSRRPARPPRRRPNRRPCTRSSVRP